MSDFPDGYQSFPMVGMVKLPEETAVETLLRADRFFVRYDPKRVPESALRGVIA